VYIDPIENSRAEATASSIESLLRNACQFSRREVNSRRAA
jgi:hypothetical protein